MDQLEYDGVENVAGYLCHRLKNVLPHIVESGQSNNSYTWVNHLSEGGLTKPTPQFVEKVARMEKIFTDINKDSLYACKGYIQMLIDKARDIDCDQEAKKLFFRSRMFFEIRKLNANIAKFNYQKKRKISKFKK
ncbi:uncharacterized protein LOC120780115 [Bactrocera tryoni]|uniref:uncharacterized protein LOC120780115 n=1 Tax=Bactrocera tryoni TaxID=59916 RepID=UPI001A95E620|nr:uncharacterized protein LOC120780115 [Bactrocera tryoni]